MTCIAAAVKNGKMIIGSDSAGCRSHNLFHRRDPKIFENGEFLFGFTSSYRMGQLLRYQFTPPLHDPRKEIMQYMVQDFIEAVRTCLKTGGYTTIKDNEEKGGTFLVCYRGQIFNIENDFQVGQCMDSFDACGSGEDFANASMRTLSKSEHDPQVIVTEALESAEYYCTDVRRPFLYLEKNL